MKPNLYLPNNDSNDHTFRGHPVFLNNVETTFMSLTALPDFSDQSFEELRMECYKKYNIFDKGIQNFLNARNKEKPIINLNNRNTLIDIIEQYLNEQEKKKFENKHSGGLFGNNNNEQGGGLFGNNNNIQSKSLFGNNNNEQGGDFFGNNNNTQSGSLFGNNNNEQGGDLSVINTNNNNNIQIRRGRNNKCGKKEIMKCKHDNNYISYYIKDPMIEGEGGLLCYKCLYEYHKDHTSQCIPIDNNEFDNYKDFYKKCINKFKNNLKDKFDEIISKLEEYENEEIENISDLLEEKIDLNFNLPIEVPFYERLEIAINRKIHKLLDNILYNCTFNYNCLNLFKNNMNELKFSKNNPNTNEKVNMKSHINFDLYGIGIPKIIDNNSNSLKISIYEGNSLLGEITEFENKDNLTLGIFHSSPIPIQNSHEYIIELNGIDNLDYINDEENYNDNSKIDIESSNTETILACLINK